MKRMKTLLMAISILGLIALMNLVSCKEPLAVQPQEDKFVCITVDDAPNFPEETEDLLDIFEEYNVKATFFCIGDALRKESKLAARIANEHTLANHTMSHPRLTGCNCFSYEVHIGQYVCDSVNTANNQPNNTYFRPPHGAIDSSQMNNLKSTGLELTMWDISAEDWNPDIHPDYIHQIIMEEIWDYEIPIILFHLGDNTEKGVKRILNDFKRKNIKIISLEERERLLSK